MIVRLVGRSKRSEVNESSKFNHKLKSNSIYNLFYICINVYQLYFAVHNENYNVMIGVESVTMCFIRVHIACQAKSENDGFIARICFKLNKLNYLNSHEVRIGKSWR